MEEKQNQNVSTASTAPAPAPDAPTPSLASTASDFLIRSSDGSFFHSGDVEQMKEEPLSEGDWDEDDESDEQDVEAPKQPTQEAPAPVIRFDAQRFASALQRMGKKGSEPLSKPEPKASQSVVIARTQIEERSDESKRTKQSAPRASEGPVSHAPGPDGQPTNIPAIANRLLRETQTTLPDDRFRARFESIIDSRMKEVRDAVSFTDMITRGVKIGGLGIDPLVAVKMSRLLDGELSALHGRLSGKENKSAAPAEKHPGASERVLEHLREIQKGAKKAPEEKAAVAPPPPQQPAAPAIIPLESEQPQPPPPPPAIPQEVIPQPIRIRKTAPDHPDRPKVEDIKSPRQQLVGPVEELKILNLTDFRRMGASIEEMKENLMERFDLLREDSLTRLHEGIAAWKESEVYRTYLDMGRESMESGKPVASVILERSQANRPYLSKEEFDMISEVNAALRS